jgi:hypothetical protein
VLFLRYLHEDGAVTWELRPTLNVLRQVLVDKAAATGETTTSPLKPNVQLRCEAANYASFLELLGFTGEAEIIPNKNSTVQLKLPLTAMTREETTVPTLGKLALHVFWAHQRADADVQEVAQGIFSTFVQRILPAPEHLQALAQSILADAAECQDRPAVEDGVCLHMDPIRDAIMGGGCPHQRFGAACVMAAMDTKECASCVRGLARALRSVANLVDSTIPDMETEEYMGKVSLVETKERRRIPEAVKAATLKRPSMLGRGRESRVAQDVPKGVRSSLIKKWEVADGMTARNAAMRHFEGMGPVVVREQKDGTTLSRKECYIYGIRDSRGLVTMPMLQVCREGTFSFEPARGPRGLSGYCFPRGKLTCFPKGKLPVSLG